MAVRSAFTTAIGDGIAAIDTEYGRPLAVASHLIVESGHAAFVDTGANASVPLLLDGLAQQGLDAADVDYVFLTHIHLDHAGGAGTLMQRLPNARCVVHPRGARHMIDPTKLILGTEAVYGVEQTRALYGDIVPIEESRIVVPDDEQWFDLEGRKLQTLFTEGHARHHYCLNDPASRGVFTGDSFGVSYRELDTAAGEFIFPTTTPASFDPEEAHKAIDRIIGCDPEQVFLTHYSRVGNLDRLATDMHDGIDAFVQIARANANETEPFAAIQADMIEYLTSRLRAHGYNGDNDALRSILELDTTLNSQGLVSWLQRIATKG